MSGLLVDVIGIDHVCIGTDTKLASAYRPAGSGGFGPKPGGPASQPGGSNAGNQQEVRPRDNKDQNGPGGGKNSGRIGEDTNLTWQDQKVGFYYAFVDALLKTGFTGNIGFLMSVPSL